MCYNTSSLLFQLVTIAVSIHSHWEVFLEINLNEKTLRFYTSWVLGKNQCRSTVRKYALLWNKHKNQQYDIFIKNIFNPFMVLVSFCTSWNTSENQRFPDVFRRHWKRPVHTMKWVKNNLIFSYLFCYLYKYLKIVCTTEKLFTKWMKLNEWNC